MFQPYSEFFSSHTFTFHLHRAYKLNITAFATRLKRTLKQCKAAAAGRARLSLFKISEVVLDSSKFGKLCPLLLISFSAKLLHD